MIGAAEQPVAHPAAKATSLHGEFYGTGYLCFNCNLRSISRYRHPSLGMVCPACLHPVGEPAVGTQQRSKRTRRSDSQTKNKTARRVRSLLRRDGSLCWLCGDELGDDITLDHVVPRSKGGKNALPNLRLAHGPCNRKRGNSDVRGSTS